MFTTFPIVILMIADDDDREFMKVLYLEYYSVMRREAFSILGRTQPIDDLIQDACVSLIEKISILRALNSCRLHAYVVSTIKNRVKNFIKHSDIEKKHTYMGMEDDARESIVDNRKDMEATVLNVESIRAVMSKLPERDSQLLECKYILSMNDTEVGKQLDIKPSSVREYLTRARRKALILMQEGEESSVK